MSALGSALSTAMKLSSSRRLEVHSGSGSISGIQSHSELLRFGWLWLQDDLLCIWICCKGCALRLHTAWSNGGLAAVEVHFWTAVPPATAKTDFLLATDYLDTAADILD